MASSAATQTINSGSQVMVASIIDHLAYIEELEKDNKVLSQWNETLEEDNKSLRLGLTKAHRTIGNLEVDKTKHQNQLAERDRQLARLQDAHRELTIFNEAIMDAKYDLEREKDRLRFAKSIVKADKRDLEKENSTQKQLIATLELELKMRDSTIKNLDVGKSDS